MAFTLEEFVVKLGLKADTSQEKRVHDSFERVKSGAAKVGNAIKWVSGIISAYSVVVGRQTADMYRYAKAVGLSAEYYESLSEVMHQMGVDSKEIVDIIEEMNNKLGEFAGLGKMESAQDALKMLGIQFKEIKNLTPEEQFIKIMDTAKEMQNMQKAVSAVDMLMGGRANVFLGNLRTYDQSLKEIVDEYQSLNVLTKESRDNVVKFDTSIQKVTAVIKFLGTEVFATLGEVLEPTIKKLLEWVKTNKDLIRQKLHYLINKIRRAFEALWPIVKRIWDGFKKLTDAVGGFENAVKLALVAVGSQAFVDFLALVVKLQKAVRNLTIAQFLFGASLALPLLLAAGLILLFEDLWVSIKGGESVLDHFAEYLRVEFPKVYDTLVEFVKYLQEVGLVLDDFWEKFSKPLKAYWDRETEKLNKAGEKIMETADPLLNKSHKASLATRLELAGERFSTPLVTPMHPAVAPSQSTVNNARTVQSTRQTTTVNAPITINAAKGQTPDDIANELQKLLGEKMSTAVTANSTGVVR